MGDIDFDIGFTERALAAIRAKHGEFQMNFKGPRGVALLPNAGDLLNLPRLEEFNFVVLAREFKYGADNKLRVTALLDLIDDEDQKLRLVR